MSSKTDTDTWRIVILGKTGCGKTSLANTIFGEKIFEVDTFPNSGTDKCYSETRNVNGRNIHLVDTPGLFDTDPEDTKATEELVKCITECAPGPHAFLLVMKVEKYTEHEMDVVNIILKYFSEEVLKYTTVLFTRGDDLPEGMKIEEWVKQNSSLNDLVQKCGGRCHVFDNKYWKNSEDEYRNNQNQIRELMKTIDKTVSDNEGKFYTNDLLKKTGEQIEQEKTRLRATSSGDKSDEDIHKEAKDNVFKKLWLHIKDNPVGIILGGLLGVTVMVPLLLLALPCTVIGAVVGAVRAVRNKINRCHANTTQNVAEQQPEEQQTENEEELEGESEQENMVRPPEMKTRQRQAQNTLNEWCHMYRGLGYKKLQ